MTEDDSPAAVRTGVPDAGTTVEPPAAAGGTGVAVMRREPWVQMKYYSFHPCIFPAMIREVSRDIPAGSLVNVYDREGRPFGTGIFNARARVPLRVFHHGTEPAGEEELDRLLDEAVRLREACGVASQGNAYRVVHSDGDGLSGLVIDRFDDVLSVEVNNLGLLRRVGRWLPRVHTALGTRRVVGELDARLAKMEGMDPRSLKSDEVRTVRIQEHGIRYEVDFTTGHKTGFFCDQRENRLRLSRLTAGKRVADLCCYTGGFALAARVLGRAEDVTGVDLDEAAVAQARRNANLNQVRVSWVHCDAFSWARQMQRNGEKWDVMVVDPPKLILSRDEAEDGYRRYEDLNRLAVSLVQRGGWFVTCSCSGLLSAQDFEEMVCRAAHKQARRIQILDRTGAGPDHPVMSNCPEGRYLKVIWARVIN